MRICHLSDTHIHNLRYHDDYKIVFEQIFESIKENNVDCIVHTGDLAHTKTDLSPEYFELASFFLKSLADIAHTYVILGNHDGNLKSGSRQDAISPIVEALQHENLFLLKNSAELILEDRFAFNVLSIFDREGWTKPSSDDNVNIALYHGSVKGAKTDLGWSMQTGDDDVSIFDSFDYALLGDIHKQQALDKEGKIAYAGSTIQQNHGETLEKGYLLWDIKDKDTFSCEYVTFKNPKPFYTINYPFEEANNVPSNSRLRIKHSQSLPYATIQEFLREAKAKFHPHSVVAVGDIEEEWQDLSFEREDLRDLAVQEEWLKKFLADIDFSEEQWKQLILLNKEIDSELSVDREVMRNITWSMKKIEWSNLFNYGENNKIILDDTPEIIGIFGKNYSGKSSVVDSMLFTLFNTTSKKASKNISVLNDSKDAGAGKLEIEINGDSFYIDRNIKRYKKKDKDEAKVSVDFSTEELELNGVSRSDTDKQIQRYFGNYADFCNTTLSTQLDPFSFLNEGSSKRKEILSKFLNLEIFEEKLKIVKALSSDLKSQLKLYKGRDFDAEKSSLQEELEKNKILCEQKEAEILSKTEEISEAKVALQSFKDRIGAIKEEPASEHFFLDAINKNQDKLTEITSTLQQLREEEANITERIEKINNFNDKFDLYAAKNIVKQGRALQSRLEVKKRELQDKDLLITAFTDSTEVLDGIPCGSKFPECKFIQGSIKKQRDINALTVERNLLNTAKDSILRDIERIEYHKYEKYLERYQKVQENKLELSSQLRSVQERIKTQLVTQKLSESTASELRLKYEKAVKERELFEQLDSLKREQKILGSHLEKLQSEKKSLSSVLGGLTKTSGALESRFEQLESEELLFTELETKFSIYENLTRAFHSNGIPFSIIQEAIPTINAEIAKALAGVSDLKAFFAVDGKKLEIYLQHPGQKPRLLEMGSGAEKTLCSMAIRIGLLNISTLPKGDLFILDEPGVGLDAENMNNFIHILTMLKSQFKKIVLISHMSSLKDIVDRQITIDNSEGFAHIDF